MHTDYVISTDHRNACVLMKHSYRCGRGITLSQLGLLSLSADQYS